MRKCGGGFFGPNTPIVLRPINSEELSKPEQIKAEERFNTSSESPESVVRELQIENAAPHFLLCAVTPAPENYNGVLSRF